MATKLRLVFSITILFLSFYGHSQRTFWNKETVQTNLDRVLVDRFNVEKGTIFTFEEQAFKTALKSVSQASKNSKVVHFPNGKGEMLAFRVFETPVMAPELAAKFPDIKSYSGSGLNKKDLKIRFSVSHNGVQSMIVDSRANSTVLMQKGNNDKYVVYTKDGVLGGDFSCDTESVAAKLKGTSTSKPPDRILRKFRLAVSASAEYTNFHGGTVADAIAAINATVTRVNEVYETDLGISLELIANNEDVVYTNAATDPFGGDLNSEIQNTLTDVIGAGNYDIGHLFHKGSNGGNAGFIGVVCVDNRKGSAYSSAVNPVGYLFDIEFVAHEMGHQFGANHTWSYESEGTSVQAEPASGTTIMSYAGITGNNDVASSAEDYFHYYSIEQIADYVSSVSCGAIVENLANTGPEVGDVGDFIIPKSTAFVLEGSATDADIGNVLTYTWEQIDAGVVTQATFGPTNPIGANFRSIKPSISPIRYFPRLSRVLQGQLTQENPAKNSAWETVSDVERDLNFAFTVRDNADGGGQVASDLVKVSVVNSAGPFKMTSQSDNAPLAAGSVQEIVWDVANTEKAPINARDVDILLSTDGGLTFPVVLAQGTANDGSHKIVLPGLPTTQARIMIRASDNVFYTVNASNFTIVESEIVLNFSELQYGLCQPNGLVIPFEYETYLGFNEEVTFSVISPPVGLDIAFSPPTTISNTLVNMTLSNTQNLAEGVYTLRVLATGATKSSEVEVELNIYDGNFAEVELISPVNGLADSSTSIILEWTDDPSIISYDIEIATDASFTSIIESNNVTSSSYEPIGLVHETTYYWRVKPINTCGEGVFSTAFNFTTIAFSCETIPGNDLPLDISATGTPTVTSKLVFFEDLKLSDVKVNLDIDHTYVSDLEIRLTSPSGTTVVLISGSCGDLSNIDATFDDSADVFVCGGNPAISGLVKPLGSLSSFKGESILGEWTLQVSDNAASDGGSIKNFSLEFCIEGEFRPDADKDGIFDDGDDLCLGTPDGVEVDSNGCEVFRFPSDNFSLAIQSESCRNANDGSISITGALPINYEISITGSGTDITENFKDDFNISGLASGTYNVCINATQNGQPYEPHCFDVIVTEPDPLGVSSRPDFVGAHVTLSLQGADIFFVEINGESIQTSEKEITLGLKNGTNSLKVSTALECQGVYEEEFFLSDRPLVYPNPFVDFTNIFMQTGLNNLTISIFASDGQFIKSRTFSGDDTEAELYFSGLPSGIYYVKFVGPNVKAATKVIKQ